MLIRQYNSIPITIVGIASIITLAFPLTAILTPHWARYAGQNNHLKFETHYIDKINRDFEYDELWVGPFFTKYNQLPLQQDQHAEISSKQLGQHPEAPSDALVVSSFDNRANTISDSFTSKLITGCRPLTKIPDVGAYYSLYRDDAHRCEKFRSSQAFFVMSLLFKGMGIIAIFASISLAEYRYTGHALTSLFLLLSSLFGAMGLVTFAVLLNHRLTAMGYSTCLMLVDVIVSFALLILNTMGAVRKYDY